MSDTVLSQEIYKAALACGYDNCGILPISDLGLDVFEQRLEERKRRVPSGAANYAWMKRFSEIQKIYPWAESVIVCVTWQGKYKYPEPLRGKYAKAYMLSSHTVPVSREHREKLGLEKWFSEHEIRFNGGCMSAPGYMFPMRHAGLDGITELFQPENILKAPDDVLRERVVPKTDSHILESELQTLRISAERVLRYMKNKG